MTERNTDENYAAASDSEGLSPIQHIGVEALCLKKIAEGSDHQFLTYLLQLVVLETKVISEGADVN